MSTTADGATGHASPIPALLEWAAQRGVDVSRVQPHPHKLRSLVAACDIPANDWCIQLPQELLLWQASALDDPAWGADFAALRARASEAGAPLDQRLVLCLLLVVMKSRGDVGPWGPYLASLPDRYDDPWWWPDSAVAAVRNTRVGAAITAQGGNIDILEKWRDELAAVHRERTGDAGELEQGTCFGVRGWGMTRDAVLWAKSTVWSRAFNIHRLQHAGRVVDRVVAMVPVADMLDHDPSHNATWHTGPEARSAFAMVTRTGRRRGQELYNNYGRKSNEEFILGYGFALASNPYDFVRVAPAARGVSGPDAARRDRLRTELGLNGAHYLMRRDPLPENLLSAVRVMVMPEAQVCAMLRGVGAGAGAGESGEKVIGGAGEASGGAGEGAAEAVAVGGKRSDGGGSALGIGAGDDEDYANAINAFATVTGAEDPHPRSHAWTEAELMRSDVSTELSVLRAVQVELERMLRAMPGPEDWQSDAEAACNTDEFGMFQALTYRAAQKEILTLALAEVSRRAVAILRAVDDASRAWMRRAEEHHRDSSEQRSGSWPGPVQVIDPPFGHTTCDDGTCTSCICDRCRPLGDALVPTLPCLCFPKAEDQARRGQWWDNLPTSIALACWDARHAWQGQGAVGDKERSRAPPWHGWRRWVRVRRDCARGEAVGRVSLDACASAATTDDMVTRLASAMAEVFSGLLSELPKAQSTLSELNITTMSSSHIRNAGARHGIPTPLLTEVLCSFAPGPEARMRHGGEGPRHALEMLRGTPAGIAMDGLTSTLFDATRDLRKRLADTNLPGAEAPTAVLECCVSWAATVTAQGAVPSSDVAHWQGTPALLLIPGVCHVPAKARILLLRVRYATDSAGPAALVVECRTCLPEGMRVTELACVAGGDCSDVITAMGIEGLWAMNECYRAWAAEGASAALLAVRQWSEVAVPLDVLCGDDGGEGDGVGEAGHAGAASAVAGSAVAVSSEGGAAAGDGEASGGSWGRLELLEAAGCGASFALPVGAWDDGAALVALGVQRCASAGDLESAGARRLLAADRARRDAEAALRGTAPTSKPQEELEREAEATAEQWTAAARQFAATLLSGKGFRKAARTALKGEIKSLMAAGAGAVDCGEKHIECAVCRELYVDRVHEALRSRMSALKAAPKRKRSDSE